MKPSHSILLFTPLFLRLADAQFDNFGGEGGAFGGGYDQEPEPIPPSQQCTFALTETIPDGMIYNNPGTEVLASTIDTWLKIINEAERTIYISAFYWTLTNTDSKVTLEPGEDFKGLAEGVRIMEALINAGKRNVSIRIVQNTPNNNHLCEDSLKLATEHLAEVRNMFMPRYIGGGVLHTKFIIADEKAFYLGSANMDWRALTDVKELGVYVGNCPDATNDLMRIFHVYWGLSVPNAVFPSAWPQEFATDFNHQAPMKVYNTEREQAFVFFGSSPPKFCPPGRSTDLQAIMHVLARAKRFAFISVMSYRPFRMYVTPPRYWGIIDSAIRAAAIERKVEIRMLVSKWRYFKDNTHHFLKSLMALTGVSPRVKLACKEFFVPSDAEQEKIPYARVNHAKFVVTDNCIYIGTSNWIANYFIDTAGASIVLEGKTKIRRQLQNIFLRDWNSEFAVPINLYNNTEDIGADPLG